MKEIFDLINKELDSNIDIICSWGIRDKEILSNGISFSVDGFKYNGKIVITPQEKQVTIFFVSTNEIIEGVLIPNIVEILDKKIEQTQDYELKIQYWLGKIVNSRKSGEK